MENYYFDTARPQAAYEIGVQLTQLILESEKSLTDVVILCIGTDRSTGDSLGPIIGYKLSGSPACPKHKGIAIYGTLEAPVHATNLETTLDMINTCHKDCYTIAIDASLGASRHIGYVTVGTGPLKPGLGVNKCLPDVGDLHITGIVNVSGSSDPMLLQTTRLKTVMRLADAISDGLLYCLDPMHSNLQPHISLFNPVKLTHYLGNRQGKQARQ